jgi:hypothetical protein
MQFPAVGGEEFRKMQLVDSWQFVCEEGGESEVFF